MRQPETSAAVSPPVTHSNLFCSQEVRFIKLLSEPDYPAPVHSEVIDSCSGRGAELKNGGAVDQKLDIIHEPENGRMGLCVDVIVGHGNKAGALIPKRGSLAPIPPN